MTNEERAQILKGVLDQVTDNDQARALVAVALRNADDAVAKMAGFSSGEIRDLIEDDANRLREAAALLPPGSAPVDGTWFQPDGARRRIQAVYADVWAQEKLFPAGTGWADDWVTFADGFVGTMEAELRGVAKGAASVVAPVVGVLSPILIPVAVVAVLVLGLVLFARFGGKAGAA